MKIKLNYMCIRCREQQQTHISKALNDSLLNTKLTQNCNM